MVHEDAIEPETERTVEYAVNVSDGITFPWNPFEQNFAWSDHAEEAALQQLRDNPELQNADVHELVIQDNQITADACLRTFTREDITESPSPF